MDAQPQPASPRALDLSHDYPRFGIDPPGPVSTPPKANDIVAAVFFAADVLYSDAPTDAKAEAVRYALSLVGDRADAPHILEAIQNKLNALHNIAAGDISRLQAEHSAMKAEVRTAEEDLETARADVKALREDVDELKSKLDAVFRFTSTLQVERAKMLNMEKPGPDNLEQVPGPDGTSPWNASIQGLNGEAVVLTPLVSLHAVQALGADELGAYVQFYYPGQEVPTDMKERRKRLLRAIGRPDEAHRTL